jgi:hypothetical protein
VHASNPTGNILANPVAGLLFIDWLSGDTVQLTGRAAVELDDRSQPGAQRTVRFQVRRAPPPCLRPLCLRVRAGKAALLWPISSPAVRVREATSFLAPCPPCPQKVESWIHAPGALPIRPAPVTEPSPYNPRLLAAGPAAPTLVRLARVVEEAEGIKTVRVRDSRGTRGVVWGPCSEHAPRGSCHSLFNHHRIAHAG